MRRRLHVEPSSDFPTINFDPYEMFLDDLEGFSSLHVVDDEALCEAYVNALRDLNTAQMALIQAAQPAALSVDEIANFTAARLEWEQIEKAVEAESPRPQGPPAGISIHVDIQFSPEYKDEVEEIKQELNNRTFGSADELLNLLRKISKNS